MKTIEEIKQAIMELENNNSITINTVQQVPYSIGDKVFIRTVTYHVTGEVIAIIGKFIKLKNCAWIADSGRFTQAINNGELDEVEPVNCIVTVNTDSIVDSYEWNHELPNEQK